MSKTRIVTAFSSVSGASLEANSVERRSLTVPQKCVESVVYESSIKFRQVIQQGKLNSLYALINYIPGDLTIEINFLKIKDWNISFRVLLQIPH